MDDQKVNIKQIIIYAGAFIAFLIGSGFATGQEILQYFASYGYMGIFGVLVIFVLYLYVGVSFTKAGYENKFHKRSDIYTYYCGKAIGTFYDYFSIIFIYMSFIVMIGGAGATLNQQYGLPNFVGGIGMAILAGGTVILGLNKIVDVIGKIGPVIAVMAISLGVAAIVQNPGGLSRASEIIPTLHLLKASTNWLFAAASYVGFCMLWLATFMSSMGAEAKSKKEVTLGAIFGAIGFSAAVLLVSLGIMAHIEQVAGSMVPSLILARNIHPIVAIIFSLAVVAGIYTTAVPLLWTVVARISDEKSRKFIILVIVLAMIGTIIGLKVPFNQLVNIIYVINGYVGILLLALMIIKDIRMNNIKNVEN
jgi:uncharacterized membrane protein YkvI